MEDFPMRELLFQCPDFNWVERIADFNVRVIAVNLLEYRPDNEKVVNPVEGGDLERRRDVRWQIEELEAAIRREIGTGNMPEVSGEDEKLKHMFIEGVYVRELLIPAGTVVIGKLHRFPRICIISAGVCSFVTEFGSMCVEAPYSAVMPPGTKTAVYAHTDTVWTAIHGTFETDLKKLDEIFVADNHSQLEPEEQLRLGV